MGSLRSRSLLLLSMLLAGCVSSENIASTSTETHAGVVGSTPTGTAEIPSVTSTPQPRLLPVTYGPEAEDFPPGANPLTGLAVSDAALLDLPAVLVSISNMPVTARPQAGPGFASWVYELYIGEGATRFMNVFYGEYPRLVPTLRGGCAVRENVFRPTHAWVGNRVWLDENENGRHDDWEMGVSGVCVSLYRNDKQEEFWRTTTDSNGYYAFEIPTDNTGKLLDGEYELRFEIPGNYAFTTPNVGDDDHDSDADPASGQTSIFQFKEMDTSWDAGLILSEHAPIATASILPPNWFIPNQAYVGPIRSGRLTYNQIGRLFPNSCLVYASAAWDIGERLDACEIVYGVDKTTPNSALLTVQRMRELAEEQLNPRQPVNYSGNLFSETLPANGQPAESIRVFYHAYTQSGWEYDPVSQTYLRFTDQADGQGQLIPATDRLTGRQMAFENVIVLFAEHERFRHNQLEVNLERGQKGWAYLFRDGQVFKIQWSTIGRAWEQSTGLMRPIHFVDAQNNLISLHSGQTWIHLVTPYSSVTSQGVGKWLVQFVQPEDPLDTPTP
ncbi:MAG TPA: SdrD B-like domain-containing protein [Anaerolineales bacterium]|nr:SdrD B-like domain-containing protein [Anaerolineales bacterium]